MDFTVKTAISTGAASGMGLLFAQNFAELGGNVVLCDVNEQVLNEKVSEINAKGQGKAIGVVCDVRDYKQVCNARDKAVETFGSIDVMANFACGMANKATVPVCFHLDHGAGECEVVRSLRMGMTGIMIDVSMEELERNIEKTKSIVRLCDYVGVGVEGELGHVGKAADGDEGVVTEYTRPDEAKKYVEETGVCALAIMVGTAHGRYKKVPVLDIERIKEIKKATNVALVLHGGSGVPDEQIKAAIKAGIRKMNFSTDLCYSFLDACRERDKSIVGIDLFMTEPIQRVQDFAEMKIQVLGANNRV